MIILRTLSSINKERSLRRLTRKERKIIRRRIYIKNLPTIAQRNNILTKNIFLFIFFLANRRSGNAAVCCSLPSYPLR